ncbi:MAG: RagB/SusD family nutrient uptake outer membrane protein [Candidatus Cryptobacteroides sp.]
MKKTILTIAAAAALLAESGCNKFLDMEPDDRLTDEMVFNDITRTKGWQAACYNFVPHVFGAYIRDWGHVFLSDDAQISPSMGAFTNWARIVAFNNGSMSASFGLQTNSNVWNQVYKKVRSCYMFMEKAHPIEEQGLTAEQVVQLKNECRFLVAFYYETMLELYGAFPLVTRLIPSDTSVEDLMMTRTPLEEIAEWLDNEFLELSGLFPVRYGSNEAAVNESKDEGRPTKGICLALRARLNLWLASPIFNGNPDLADVVNPDGTHIFPLGYDASKWDRAAAALKDFIDFADSGVYSLYREYDSSTGQIDPFASLKNMFFNNTNNPEIVWQTNSYSWGDIGSTWISYISNPRGYVGGYGYFGATLNLADCFFMKNGQVAVDGYDSAGNPVINEASGYSETGYSTADSYYPNTTYDLADGETPGLITPRGTFNMYVDREPRFYTTLWYNGEYIPNARRVTQFWSGGLDGGPSHDSPQCGLLVRKFLSNETDPKNGIFVFQPSIQMRLAEFYLSYAEALNECDYEANRETILHYLNLIRERAGIPVYGDDATFIAEGKQVAAPTDQDSMRKAIRRERRVEMACEGPTRYNDIRRWKIGVELFKTPIYGMNVGASTNDGFYRRVSYMTRAFDTKHYLWPIPQSYINKNENLIQNPGW